MHYCSSGVQGFTVGSRVHRASLECQIIMSFLPVRFRGLRRECRWSGTAPETRFWLNLQVCWGAIWPHKRRQGPALAATDP